jgi:osmotically-inducible protein OsmY
MESNPELQRRVEVQLAREQSLHAGQLGVRVRDGVVTLTGAMRSDLERWQVGDAVRAVPGVQGPNDETMVYAVPPIADVDGDVVRSWFPAER